MSVVDNHSQTQETPACPGCAKRDAKIARLEEQLADRCEDRELRHPFFWWLMLGLGLCLLGIAPVASVLAFWLFDMLNEMLPLPLAMTIRGAMVSLRFVQFAVVAIVLVLHWRPWWYRTLVGAILGFFFLSTLIGPVFVNDGLAEPLIHQLPMIPMTVVITALPLFLMRLLHRWTIARRGTRCEARPVTITSYLLVFTICGIASGFVRFADLDVFSRDSAALAVRWFVFQTAIPSAIVGSLFAVLLPAVLNRAGRQSNKRAICMVGVGLIALIGPLAQLVVVALAGDPTFDSGTAIVVVAMQLGITASGLVAAFAVCFWMRWLGYRLLSKSDVR